MKYLNTFFIIAILLVALPTPRAYALGIPGDSISVQRRVVERWSNWDMMRGPYLDNVALHAFRYQSSLSTFGFRMDGNRNSNTFLHEYGQGQNIYQLFANTYLQPSEKEHIWGNASYYNGKKYGIKWNSTSDYETLYPYIVADTIGGNMLHETYAFGGGYSRNINQIRVSGEVAYRSLQEYRKKDPRPRNIVSDLKVNTGIAYTFRGYHIGASVGCGQYKQRSSVSFYSPLGTVLQYLSEGLGSSFNRFNSDDPAVYYRGYSYSASLHIASKNPDKGLIGEATYRGQSLQQILTKLNEVPIHQHQTRSVDVRLGYLFTTHNDHLRWMIDWHGNVSERVGTEHIIGEPKAGTYPIVGYLRNFIGIEAESQISFHLSKSPKSQSNWHWYVERQIGFQLIDIRKIEPEKRLKVVQWGSNVKGQLSYIFPHQQMMALQVKSGFTPKAKGLLTLPYITMPEYDIKHIEYTYQALTCSRFGLTVAPKYYQTFNLQPVPFGIEVALEYTYTRYNTPTPIHHHGWLASIQMAF